MSAKLQRVSLSLHAAISPGMGNNIPDWMAWRLQIRFSGGIKEASFRSRPEALEQARALIGDYGYTISITLVSPQGITETLQGLAFTSEREHAEGSPSKRTSRNDHGIVKLQP